MKGTESVIAPYEIACISVGNISKSIGHVDRLIMKEIDEAVDYFRGFSDKVPNFMKEAKEDIENIECVDTYIGLYGDVDKKSVDYISKFQAKMTEDVKIPELSDQTDKASISLPDNALKIKNKPVSNNRISSYDNVTKEQIMSCDDRILCGLLSRRFDVDQIREIFGSTVNIAKLKIDTVKLSVERMEMLNKLSPMEIFDHPLKDSDIIALNILEKFDHSRYNMYLNIRMKYKVSISESHNLIYKYKLDFTDGRRWRSMHQLFNNKKEKELQ